MLNDNEALYISAFHFFMLYFLYSDVVTVLCLRSGEVQSQTLGRVRKHVFGLMTPNRVSGARNTTPPYDFKETFVAIKTFVFSCVFSLW